MSRIEVLKTYKIFIGGQFPRTESGRYYTPLDSKGKALANICLSSRKDVRNAVVAARKAIGPWSERAAFNRGQILYRIAEMLEGRHAQFVDELMRQGSSKVAAANEVNLSIDRIVYYAGWCDKYNQVVSSVNPVSSSHFNFSSLEPMGVVGVVAEQSTSLIGLVSLILPAICGGNSTVVLASENLPLCAVTFGEVIHSSDVPAGVINILTGSTEEMAVILASHMDVNALITSNLETKLSNKLALLSVDNLKRKFDYEVNWVEKEKQALHYISDLQEIKTTWHPIENV
ncbi:MAG: aldehyde dehydrogenase family protein, partial [Crocinitomicaceae bacterium]|nr:aldehyde dehydrogenase family protein [Crocinitomicaceae bacterium]